jgi:hypothetical protein
MKFRRQQPIGACIVDFYCAVERLFVEVDGGIKLGQKQGALKTRRFWCVSDAPYAATTKNGGAAPEYGRAGLSAR